MEGVLKVSAKSPRASVLSYMPGLLLTLAIGLPALLLQGRLAVNGKEVVSAVAIALVLGILIRNTVGIPAACRPGASLAVKRLLRVGIALMGPSSA